MRKEHFGISAPAVVAASLIYYLAPTDKLLAVLLPVIFHELGHILALRLLGLRICRFRIELKGLCMEYRGCTGGLGHALAAAAGPALGLLYALAASLLAVRYNSGWLALTAGVSLLLSAFNLLPALPLDGGRILYHLSAALFGDRAAARVTDIVSLAVGTALLVLGVYLMFRGFGLALELAAVWLLLSTGLRALPPHYHEIT